MSLRREARTIYGSDAQGYDAGRPDYPADVYQILASRCGLRAGASVVEIGPGTGLVTRRLMAADAQVVAVEPDQNMAAYLAAAVSSDMEIIPGTFEQAPLPQDRFDLAVAATSFHWVDQAAGLPKLGRVIRPGGWAAVSWTIFDDPGRQDAFRDALRARAGDGDPGGQRNARFQLDTSARRRDLADRAGLTGVSGNLIRWTAELDTAQLRALYASMIGIRRLPADGQRRILDQISLLADHDFAGRVQWPFITAMYTGRRPGRCAARPAWIRSPLDWRTASAVDGRGEDAAELDRYPVGPGVEFGGDVERVLQARQRPPLQDGRFSRGRP